MFTRSDFQEMQSFLRGYHTMVIQPEIEHLNQFPKLSTKKKTSDSHIKKMAGKMDIPLEELQQMLNRQAEGMHKQQSSHPEPRAARPLPSEQICRSLLAYATRHNRKNSVYQICQLHPVSQYFLSSKEKQSIQTLTDLAQVKELPRPYTRGTTAEKMNAYLKLNGTDPDIWLWTEDHHRPYPLTQNYICNYACWPDKENAPSIYMKFNSFGEYFMRSSRKENPKIFPDSETHISISASLTYGQIRQISETIWEAWHLKENWPILEQGGTEIAKSDWIDGAQFHYVEVPSGYEIWTDVPLFTSMQLTLSCSVRDLAFAIIDFQGWEDLPHWFLFDIWVLGATPL